MKHWIKLAGTALLAGTAAVCAWAAVGGIAEQALTDIEVGTLREADRQILNTGLAVADREELLTLLEDLGS